MFPWDARKKKREAYLLVTAELALFLKFSDLNPSCTFLLAPSGATSSQADEKSPNQFSQQLPWHCFFSMTWMRKLEDKYWQGMKFLSNILVSLHAHVINNFNQLDMTDFLRNNTSYVGQQRNTGLNLALRVLILSNYLPQNPFINYLC